MFEIKQKKINFRKVIKIGLSVMVLIALIHVIHAVTLDRIIEYKEVSFYSPNVTAEMDGYRIAFITDTHRISERRLQSVADELNQRNINLLILGGDFAITKEDIIKNIKILSQIKATDGIYGVEGNHDRHGVLFAIMEEHGITPLSNSGLYIRDNFFLAGVEDFWNMASIADAAEGSTTDDFVLLISHNPDVTMIQSTVGLDLILSGHTHGGQITFFGIFAPYLTFRTTITDYGQRFKSGWTRSRDDIPVFVSNGTGEYLPRVFARPQVILITLSHE